MDESRVIHTLSVNRDGSLMLSAFGSCKFRRDVFTGRLVFCEMLVKFKRHWLVWFGLIYFE
jgi:hypothetical protein